MNKRFYDQAVEAFHNTLGKHLQSRAGESDLLGQANRRRFAHGPHTNQTDVHGRVRVSEMKQFSATFTLQAAWVLDGNVADFKSEIEQAAAAMRRDVTLLMFEVVAEAAESVGNSLTVQSKEFTKEGIYELVERVAVQFDEQGRPVIPTMVVHPDRREELEKILDEPGVRFRLDAIFFAKWLEHFTLKP